MSSLFVVANNAANNVFPADNKGFDFCYGSRAIRAHVSGHVHTYVHVRIYTSMGSRGLYSCVVIVMESTYCVEAMVRRMYFATLACCSGVKLA